MNAETLAEWYRVQGRSVIRSQSSYWCSLAPRVFQSFPFFWLIEPDEQEIRDLFWRRGMIGFRYSAAAGYPLGVESYHVICEDKNYDLKSLARQSRQNISKGLSECTIEPIAFARLAGEGYQLHLDSMGRQNCRPLFSRRLWERAWCAAADLPGFEVWGAMVQGKLAAVLIFVRVDDWVIYLSQQSVNAYLQKKPNHALVYSITKQLLSCTETKAIFYTLESLDAEPDIDEFKFRMGFRKCPVKQRAVFHPLLFPAVNSHTEGLLCRFYSLRPSNGLVSKARGLIHLAVKEQRPSKPPAQVPEPVGPTYLPCIGRGDLQLRKAVAGDAMKVAELHYQAGRSEPGAFLPYLGVRFLSEYYRILIDESDGLVLCVVDRSGEIVGFVASVFNLQEHFARLREARFRLLRSVGFRAFHAPKLLLGVYRRNTLISRICRGHDNAAARANCRIEYWAWSTEQRNHSGSVVLLLSLLRELRSRGQTIVQLEVDMHNRRVWAVHQMLGARVVRHYRTYGGRERLLMEHDLTEGSRRGETASTLLMGRTVRKMATSDVTAAVTVHVSSFPNFFLSFLGPRFLELLYCEILREPGNVSLVACNRSGEVVGFVVGVSNQSHLYRRLAHRRWWAFAVVSGAAVFRNPRILPRLVRAFGYPAKAKSAACPALLMSLAVAPDARGKGIGRLLVDQFLAEMKNSGIMNVSLVTDRDNNDETNRFYIHYGFSRCREFGTPEGRWMNEYVITAHEGEPDTREVTAGPRSLVPKEPRVH